MSDQAETVADGEDALLRSVCREARDLLGRVSGPVKRLSVQGGEHRVEIEWDLSAMPAAPGGAVGAVVSATVATPDEVPGRFVVTAPLVGAFYRASEPGAAPFVSVGDMVEADQEVAIIEAMKMMNRIPCEVSGKVTAILVEDGVMVEFGQALMYVDPPDSD